METVHQIEKAVGGWMKSVPHLPENWRKWLATNAWWLVLIGVILSILGTLALIGVLLSAMAIVGSVATVYGLNVVPVYTGWWYITSIVSAVILVVTIIINAKAIQPLKAMSSKGWDLLFLTFLLGVISAVVSVLSNFGNIVSAVIGVVIGAYILFEVRGYFKKA